MSTFLHRFILQLLSVFFWAVVLVAQVAVAAEATGGEPSGTLPGMLISWLAVAALSLVTLLMGLAGAAMARRAKDSKVWTTVNSLWVVAQTVVAHVEREIRPSIQKSLADGKLSSEEAKALKAEAIKLFKEAAGKSLGDLQKLLGLTEGAIGTFVSGLLERALASTKPAASVSPSLASAADEMMKKLELVKTPPGAPSP